MKKFEVFYPFFRLLFTNGEILVARGIVRHKFSYKSHLYVFSDPLFSGYCMANSFVPGPVILSSMPATAFPHLGCLVIGFTRSLSGKISTKFLYVIN